VKTRERIERDRKPPSLHDSIAVWCRCTWRCWVCDEALQLSHWERNVRQKLRLNE